MIIYVNKYTGTYDPGNSKQSVLSTTLLGAVALLTQSIEGVAVEPILVQKVESHIAVSVPDDHPPIP